MAFQNSDVFKSTPDSVMLSQHVPPTSGSGAMPTTADARAKHCIAALEDELEILWQERVTKQRKTTNYVAQGRAICRLVVLYTSLEDLITENDRRYEDQLEDSATQDHLQCGYIKLSQMLPWLHVKLGTLEHEEPKDMLKKLKKGANTA
ncbi:hypothetical protein BDR07DRAFT_1492761 [Suillus spraguei]|nr:hypothetical protein BDR07DRAFT_1492761 [Suillus spraguei]